jgi:hypothetical protein
VENRWKTGGKQVENRWKTGGKYALFACFKQVENRCRIDAKWPRLYVKNWCKTSSKRV